MVQRQFLALLAGGLFATAAAAGPEEDYEAGNKAYKAGDVVSAMTHLRKAADAGHAKAQAAYGYILDKSEFDEEAVKYYRLSANQGEAAGEFGLGTLYASGEGVKKDMAEAVRWLTLAAQKDHYPAIQVLAGAYVKGDLQANDGNAKNVLGWLKTAADNAYVPALQALVKVYREGGLGVPADGKQADEYQAKLAKLSTPPKAAKDKK